MKNTDKMLIGIVSGVALLVVVAFVVAWLRPKPSYQAEDTPEGVVHNYLLALRQSDYARAYGYLSPTLAGYPASAEAMARDVRDDSYTFRLDEQAATVTVDPGLVTGGSADVTVRETLFNAGGLFDSGQYDNSFSVRLQHENGQWKIIDSDYYWSSCWRQARNC